MEYLIGVGLAVLVCVFASVVGFDRDRVFYPTVVIVNATYYILFAVIGASTRVLAFESLMASAFLVLAVAGFKKNLWVAVVGLRGMECLTCSVIYSFKILVSRDGGPVSVFLSTFSPVYTLARC